MSYTLDLADITRDSFHLVGRKNAYFGDMIRNLTNLGVKVPPGFAISTDAYRFFSARK